MTALLLIASTGTVVAQDADPASATTTAGCEPAAGIKVSQKHDPYDPGYIGEEPILDGRPSLDIGDLRTAGFSAPLLDERFGLPVLRATHGPEAAATYFGTVPIGPETTLSDVLADGGVRVIETIVALDQTVAQQLDEMRAFIELSAGPGRYTDVAIGEHPGLVLRGDELVEGHRFYHVWFATGRDHAFTLNSGASTADEAVDQARSLVCD